MSQFGSTANVMTPLPSPWSPLSILIQGEVATLVQEHPAGTHTESVPTPPSTSKKRISDDRVIVHPEGDGSVGVSRLAQATPDEASRTSKNGEARRRTGTATSTPAKATIPPSPVWRSGEVARAILRPVTLRVIDTAEKPAIGRGTSRARRRTPQASSSLLPFAAGTVIADWCGMEPVSAVDLLAKRVAERNPGAPITGQPLHVVVEAIVRTCHEPLREELPVVARISEEELGRHARRHPELFPQLHFEICRLRDAVLTHFENEQALLFPSVRLLENGEPQATLDLHQLVPQLIVEHLHIMSVLTSIRTITNGYQVATDSPLLDMLVSTLRRFDRTLKRYFDLERRELFARAIRLQESQSVGLRANSPAA
jgi:iron-sulfur cluster repair protein YtfE (RIC family)